MQTVETVLRINSGGKFILQKRDNKPNIRNPGKITAWGGDIEQGETPLQAALRELLEETCLRVNGASLEFIGVYPRNYKINGKQVVNHVFILRDIDENTLDVQEGEGFEIVNPKDGTDNPHFTDLTKEIITDFNRDKI